MSDKPVKAGLIGLFQPLLDNDLSQYDSELVRDAGHKGFDPNAQSPCAKHDYDMEES